MMLSMIAEPDDAATGRVLHRVGGVETLRAAGQSAPEQFAQVVLKADANGSVVRLGDVAKIGLGPESYDSISTFNGKPSASLGIV